MIGNLCLLAAHPIVHVNAGLNTLATLLLITGYVFIKQGNEKAHRNAMMTALGVSAAFLVCYLYYHYQVGSVRFTHQGVVRYLYLLILASHVILAMTVPFIALSAAHFGWWALHGDPDQAPRRRSIHRKIVRWGYPIWLYVSVTGVIVYLMLYHLWPAAEA